jgi:hypothetical protein
LSNEEPNQTWLGFLRASDEGSCVRHLVSRSSPVDIQKLQPRCLEPLRDHFGESLQQLIPQIVIFFRLGAEAFAVQADGACQFHRPSVESPAIWWNQPRPSQNIPFSDSLECDDGSLSRRYLQCHFALTDHVELVSFLPFTEQELTGFEAYVGCASDEELHVLWFKSL